MVVSDALSRAYLNNQSTEIDQPDLIHCIQFPFDNLPISDARLTEFQKKTASDTTLQQLKEYTLKGWPQQRDIPQTVKPYYNIRDEIVYNNGLLPQRYDQHAKDLPDIQPGTVVRIRAKEDEKWNQLGKVVEKCAEPRSYRLLNDKGNIVRRNRGHLIPCKDRFQIRNDFDYDDLEVTTRPSSPESPNEIVTRSGRVVRKSTRYS
ncbi:Hypothetical predicted protein [Paramuricea clavata]|uniref:Uncharacterized protein n=1 Tax=Paramuricea clavata TaxID=317549 RepID=A0A7D9HV33_PARCT|nr:Hypothetical predicted protein [Paramuricea clavata]